MNFYTGGYTSALTKEEKEKVLSGNWKERGIHLYEWEETKGLSFQKYFLGEADPSYLLMHPNQKRLYCVNETDDGSVACYGIGDDGNIAYLHRVKSFGDAPCHLAISQEVDILAVSNYMSGSIAFYALTADGDIGKLLYRHAFSGHGNHVKRQLSAHTHTAEFCGGYCYICELGCDGIYRISEDKIRSGDAVSADMERLYDFTENGNITGIRMGCFTKDGKYYFAGGELDNKIHCFEVNGWKYLGCADAGKTDGENMFAHIALNEDDAKLYGSVRGESSIVCFDVKDGKLSDPKWVDCGGIWPRYFALTKEYLLCANQRGNGIAIFGVGKDGTLTLKDTVTERSSSAVFILEE